MESGTLYFVSAVAVVVGLPILLAFSEEWIDSIRAYLNSRKRPITFTGDIPADGVGVVYLIRDKDVTGLVKIGRSMSVRRRFNSFGVDLPFETEVVLIIETDQCVSLETSLHRLCAKKRVRGEWFALDDDDIAAIRRLA